MKLEDVKAIKPNNSYLLSDNEWIELEDNEMFHRCCCCGKYHWMEFRVRDGKVQLYVESIGDEKTRELDERIKKELQ